MTSQPRASWSGFLAVGEFQVPIALVSAHRPADVELRTLHRDCRTPLTTKRWCPFHDREVEEAEVVKGWEFEPGAFVLSEPTELEAFQLPATDTIHIDVFHAARAIHPRYLDRPYLVRPAADAAGRRAHALVVRQFLRGGRLCGRGTLQLRANAAPCAVYANGATLELYTLRLNEDLLPADLYASAAAQARTNRDEAALARELADALTEDFDPAELVSGARMEIRDMLERKRAGDEIVRPDPLPARAGAPDIEAALRRTLDGIRATRGRKAA